MRALHIIIGAGLMAAFVIGGSTSSKETPTVRFGSYIDAAGNAVSGKANQATFEYENPSASLVICAFHQPGGRPASRPHHSDKHHFVIPLVKQCGMGKRPGIAELTK